uniref:Uncharacterized protein n=1 Tax=Arion vulgaris TaxID=1028688 RepID=A0A0B7AWA9_9EUPU
MLTPISLWSATGIHSPDSPVLKDPYIDQRVHIVYLKKSQHVPHCQNEVISGVPKNHLYSSFWTFSNCLCCDQDNVSMFSPYSV